MRSGGEIRLGARNGKHVLFRTTLAPESSTLPIQTTVSFFTDFTPDLNPYKGKQSDIARNFLLTISF